MELRRDLRRRRESRALAPRFRQRPVTGVLRVERLPADHFDVVVIDEFHHAAAKTYERLLEHLQPKELLGLTATPERADGRDVGASSTAAPPAELRLWDALEADLLVPFHYFGVADDVDLTGIEWKRGAYDAAGLDGLYTGNDARARQGAPRVARQGDRRPADAGTRLLRLGCARRVHGASLQRRRHPVAGCVRARRPKASAPKHSHGCAHGEVNCLFAADLFNEGLDLPEVDTILLLRPTQSATIFLQQLGRGLRRAHGKPVLTVLDFIGQHRKEFRFDVRFRALTGSSRRHSSTRSSTASRSCPRDPSSSSIEWLSRSSWRMFESASCRGSNLWKTSVHTATLLLSATWRSQAGTSPTSTRPTARGPACAETPACHRLLPGPTKATSSARARRSPTSTTRNGHRRTPCWSSWTLRYDQLADREQRLARMLFFTLWPNKGGFVVWLRAGTPEAAPGGVRGTAATGGDRPGRGPTPRPWARASARASRQSCSLPTRRVARGARLGVDGTQ